MLLPVQLDDAMFATQEVEQRSGAVPLVDVLLVLVLILMLAGTVWGWLHGYARFDITTEVWLIVPAIVR